MYMIIAITVALVALIVFFVLSIISQFRELNEPFEGNNKFSYKSDTKFIYDIDKDLDKHG